MPIKRTFEWRETTLEHTFDLFLADKRSQGLSKSTLKTYNSHFKAIGAFVDTNTSLDLMTSRNWRLIVSDMAESDLSPNSIRSYTATIKTFLSWCRKEGLSNAEIPLFKGEETVPQTYSRQELERLLKRPNLRSCTFTELRTWCIVNLLVNNGLRAGSVRSIRCQDADLDRRVILIRHNKARKTIVAPISPTLAYALRVYILRRHGKPDEPLFCTESGTEMSHDCLRNSIARYNQSRGVTTKSIHAFRHTFARMYLVDCGGDSLKLQKLLGHSTLDMTKHYTRIFDSDLVDDFQQHSPLEQMQPKKNRIKRK